MKNMMAAIMGLLFVVSFFYAVQGVNMHIQVSAEENKFHELQDKYFTISKSNRDSAPTGSVLNKELIAINQYPSELLRLKLVGVGKILTGIYVLLFGILMALIMMPVKLGAIIKGKK